MVTMLHLCKTRASQILLFPCKRVYIFKECSTNRKKQETKTALKLNTWLGFFSPLSILLYQGIITYYNKEYLLVIINIGMVFSPPTGNGTDPNWYSFGKQPQTNFGIFIKLTNDIYSKFNNCFKELTSFHCFLSSVVHWFLELLIMSVKSGVTTVHVQQQ